MIQVEQLRYRYPGSDKPMIENMSFLINSGEIFGFLGPSGAGKSTTQNILIGVLKHYEGSVKVLGQELRHTSSDYYEQIGVAFEFPNFYSKFTALENLRFFRAMYKGETEDPELLLRKVGLQEFAHTRVSAFSKGMKMRLNFCRAILNRPRVLFLDEPTSGLDPVNAKAMADLIEEQRSNGTTVLITTHNMNAAEELCDRVAFLVDGSIRLIDSPRALKLQRGAKSVKLEHRDLEGALHTVRYPLDGLAEQESFIELLRTGTVETIHTEEASLRDIFIEVTGKSL